jgi:hypothetical protein
MVILHKTGYFCSKIGKIERKRYNSKEFHSLLSDFTVLLVALFNYYPIDFITF